LRGGESLILCQKTPNHVCGWVFFTWWGFEPISMQLSSGQLLPPVYKLVASFLIIESLIPTFCPVNLFILTPPVLGFL